MILRCCSCQSPGGTCKTFRMCENPRPWRNGQVLRHGLLECAACKKLFNRDVNAASNIYLAAACAMQGEPRPQYLSRS